MVPTLKSYPTDEKFLVRVREPLTFTYMFSRLGILLLYRRLIGFPELDIQDASMEQFVQLKLPEVVIS